MDRKDVETIHFDKSEKQTLRIPVEGLPDHLHAEIVVGPGWWVTAVLAVT
jgi:hypothetical protein